MHARPPGRHGATRGGRGAMGLEPAWRYSTGTPEPRTDAPARSCPAPGRWRSPRRAPPALEPLPERATQHRCDQSRGRLRGLGPDILLEATVVRMVGAQRIGGVPPREMDLDQGANAAVAERIDTQRRMGGERRGDAQRRRAPRCCRARCCARPAPPSRRRCGGSPRGRRAPPARGRELDEVHGHGCRRLCAACRRPVTSVAPLRLDARAVADFRTTDYK